MSKDEPKSADLPFEMAVERLEKIVAEMESSKLPLEELLQRYEEGIRLVAICNERLADAESRIETLSRNTNGRSTLSSPLPPIEKEPRTNSNEEIRLF